MVDYEITPMPFDFVQDNDTRIYNFLLDVNKPQTIKIKVCNREKNNYLIVQKMILNGIEVNHINPAGIFITSNKEIKVGHNWLDANGEFIIRLHGNAVSHNFLNYILSLTKSSK